ncbi:GAF domain-containing protein [Bacillus sp. SB49]|uniref:STAS domain-containing protein n=1 Tax=Bacillus sp. SB49 TaxID=1071080 RepID=UPI0003FE842E|nr:STAS domain-containing protein [Bacillus sp. SB49]QHT47711.1 GAF domain-containing protein [Bacillus sp. SB49]
MPNEYKLDTTDFQSLRTASRKMFHIISEHLDVQTAYIAKKDDTTMTVLSSYNRDEGIINEGYTVDYGGTYCRFILNSRNKTMTTENLMQEARTKDLEVTGELRKRGFLGVELTDVDGNTFGTLCVMDSEEKVFEQEDIRFLKSIADVLSHIIELDQTQYNMALLNVPIIPITKGVSILTIQGIIDERRAKKIMDTTLRYGAEKDIDYFIIDLSGLVILDDLFPDVLAKLVHSLELMGIEALMTGITPAIAQREVENVKFNKLKARTVVNLEAALSSIGFSLVEKQ